jgi:hypothetical protein
MLGLLKEPGVTLVASFDDRTIQPRSFRYAPCHKDIGDKGLQRIIRTDGSKCQLPDFLPDFFRARVLSPSRQVIAIGSIELASFGRELLALPLKQGNGFFESNWFSALHLHVIGVETPNHHCSPARTMS